MGLLPSPPATVTSQHIRLGDRDLKQMDENAMRDVQTGLEVARGERVDALVAGVSEMAPD